VVLGAAGYAAYHYAWPRIRPSSSSGAPAPCPSRTLRPAPPPATAVSLRVRNATMRTGLAARVATALHHRGFHVHGVGNTTVTVTGTATIRYTHDQARQAQTLAAQVADPQLHRVPGKGVLDLDLGPKWRGLATPAAVRAAELADRRPTGPTPTCSASPASA
jgi:acetolactate synthase regulatory subunit